MASKTTPGARFRIFRMEVGLSGQALAEQLGVTKTAVSYWESGRVSLSHSACLLAENLFRISATWLMEGVEPMWLRSNATFVSLPSELIPRPLLSDITAFQEDGTVVPPRDTALHLGLPMPEIQAVLEACGGGTKEDLFFIRIRGHEMEPILADGDWALVYTGLHARNRIVDHKLYLIRNRPQDTPQVRRVAVEPVSGDLLFGTEAKGLVPIRITVPASDLARTILGKVCWAGGRR